MPKKSTHNGHSKHVEDDADSALADKSKAAVGMQTASKTKVLTLKEVPFTGLDTFLSCDGRDLLSTEVDVNL
jgi:hypothetical protein